MVDQGGERPKYEQIAWAIRGQIERKELRPGQKIPSLNEIRAAWDVSYATAQEAVAQLKKWKLVTTRRGDGTTVLPGMPIVEVVNSVLRAGDGRLHRWRETTAEYGMSGSQAVTGAGVAPCPADVAEAFAYEVGTPVVWRERLMVAAGDNIQIVTSYFSKEVGEALPQFGRMDRLPQWAPGVMADNGWVIDYAEGVSFARLITDAEVPILGLPIGSPVAEVLLAAFDASDEVIMVERSVSNSARIRQKWRAKR